MRMLDDITTSRVGLSMTTYVPTRESICHWRGTAPFCSPECGAGEVLCGKSRCGDGKCCTTGEKYYCCFKSCS
ncbi:hypothetical protein ACFU99_08980 [Streptomyces sp. NPDC057654]|uniref:hypothetical protein n=1 Tax=Streptomyces sp. NPDC057654 TaxID=3346196 RepID=UPI0036804AF1